MKPAIQLKWHNSKAQTNQRTAGWWGPVGASGGQWGPVGASGGRWGPVGVSGGQWGSAGAMGPAREKEPLEGALNDRADRGRGGLTLTDAVNQWKWDRFEHI